MRPGLVIQLHDIEARREPLTERHAGVGEVPEQQFRQPEERAQELRDECHHEDPQIAGEGAP